MVCLENLDTNIHTKSKKRKKEKMKQKGYHSSRDTDKNNELSERLEKICENATGPQEQPCKSKKKKQKRERTEASHAVTASAENTEQHEVESKDLIDSMRTGIPKKKKKLKSPEACNSNVSEVIVPSSDVVSSGRDGKKPKKKKRTCDLVISSDCLNDLETVGTKVNSIEKIEELEKTCTKSKVSKKLKKKMKQQLSDLGSQIDDFSTTHVSELNSEDQRQELSKSAAKNDTNPALTVPNSELCTNSGDKNKKPKKRRKDKCVEEAIIEVSPLFEPTVKPKKSKKRKKMDSNDAILNGGGQELADSSNVLPAKKRKKHTSEEENNSQSKENLPSDENSFKVKKKKSKKVSKSIETSDLGGQILKVDETEFSINTLENETMVTKKKKKKSKSKEKDCCNHMPDSNSNDQMVQQKQKKSDSASFSVLNDHVTEIGETCSATTNNDQFEPQQNAISKPKKKKKTKTAKETCNADADIITNQAVDDLGQWKTAELSSSAHEKFAKLLGARKKQYKPVVTPLSNLKAGESVLSKLTGVWKPPPERTLFGSLLNRDKKFAKMAMDQKETAKLNESLETQYTKTLEFNLQKRKEGNIAKGLGFQEDPAKGKKHYIDIHKVKSIELD